MTVDGSGALFLLGNNTYSGDTDVSAVATLVYRWNGPNSTNATYPYDTYYSIPQARTLNVSSGGIVEPEGDYFKYDPNTTRLGRRGRQYLEHDATNAVWLVPCKTVNGIESGPYLHGLD